jgi:uncharacterized protein YijF (DUF1287 family)
MKVSHQGLLVENLLILGIILIISTGCLRQVPSQPVRSEKIETQVASPKLKQFLDAALEQTTYTHSYNPAYVAIAYPGGDVPRETGVCTDVAIRAFRKIGVDLQRVRPLLDLVAG